MAQPKSWALNGLLETEEYAMPHIRNGYTVSSSCRFRAALFSAILAIALFDPGVGNAQELKQVKFTEKHVQSFIAVSGEMAKLSSGANQDKTDAELEVQAEALVKRYGFANLAEFDDVSTNISMIMSGIDQQTKRFTEAPEQIKQQIAALKADKSVPQAEKKEGLAQLDAALKDAQPIRFKENISLVVKYFDKLAELMQEQGPAD
jgi:hypothetical protein